MSPISKRALLLAVPLVAGACGGGRGDASTSTPSTLEVGGVLDAFPASSPPPTTVAATTSTSSTSTSSTSTTEPEPVAISWVEQLAGLVDGGPGATPRPTDLLRDDSGQLRVRVPKEWGDRATVGNGLAPYVAAAPDLREFLDGYEAPGLTLVVVPTPGRPDDALASYEFGECADGGRRPYVDEDATGVYQVWQDCGETDTDIVTITVTPTDRDGRPEARTAVLLAQLTDPADLTALDVAFHTLRF